MEQLQLSFEGNGQQEEIPGFSDLCDSSPSTTIQLTLFSTGFNFLTPTSEESRNSTGVHLH